MYHSTNSAVGLVSRGGSKTLQHILVGFADLKRLLNALQRIFVGLADLSRLLKTLQHIFVGFADLKRLLKTLKCSEVSLPFDHARFGPCKA